MQCDGAACVEAGVHAPVRVSGRQLWHMLHVVQYVEWSIFFWLNGFCTTACVGAGVHAPDAGECCVCLQRL
jgi:hypothetical protein